MEIREFSIENQFKILIKNDNKLSRSFVSTPSDVQHRYLSLCVPEISNHKNKSFGQKLFHSTIDHPSTHIIIMDTSI